jgi:RNA polymerase sigma factor (sigma-70 family)
MRKNFVRFRERRQPMGRNAMKTDVELLRCYVENGSESAFTELVQRHIRLVYSVALRRVGGDAQLAEDVTQTVFNDLARKAVTLRNCEHPRGWLFVSANVASAAVVRAERRRKARELAAHTMQPTIFPTGPDPDWGQLRPVIDDAILALKAEDREAVLLRFFEQRSFTEVGSVLRVTDEAARKRVDRALEKLRAALQRRGITSTSAALDTALTAGAATSVPAGLGAKVAANVISSTSAVVGGATFGGWLGLLVPTAAGLVIGALALIQRHANEEVRDTLSRFAADRDALVSLRSENRELTRTLAETDALKRAAAAPPSAPPFAPSSVVVRAHERPIAAAIGITAAGTIRWNADYVSLRDFIARMREIKATADPEARVHVRAPGASYSAVAYVIEEARKAGIEHLTVEASVNPDDTFPLWVF